jgi:hypothetical protein
MENKKSCLRKKRTSKEQLSTLSQKMFFSAESLFVKKLVDESV